MVTSKQVKASDIVITVKDNALIEDDACRMSICNVKCIHYQTLKWEEAINMVRRMEDTEVILWTFIHEEAPTTYHVDLGSMLRLTVSVQFGADMFDVTVKEETSNE
jgi:hypothetical protein